MTTTKQATKSYTIRMPQDLHDEVKAITTLTSSPMSKFIINAIKALAVKERLKLIRSLEDNLAILRNYGERDADFEQAIQMVAASEVDDNANPIEGVFFDEREGEQTPSIDQMDMEEFFETA